MAPERKNTLRNRARSIAKGNGNGLVAVRYEDSVAAKAPLAVIVAPPRVPPADTHPALRTPHDEKKRDSGLAPTTTTTSWSTVREGSLNAPSTEKNALGFTINVDASPPPPIAPLEPAQTYSPPKTPANNKIVKKSYSMSGSRWRRPTSKGSKKSGAPPKTPTSAGKDAEEHYSPITTNIPTDSLLEADFLTSISFSKRGSIMLGGKKAVNGHARPQGGRRRAFGRSPSNSASFNAAFRRAPSRKVSARSLNTQVSSTSVRSNPRAQLRAAANLLPGNRDRRWRDEAGDMLTLPPGLADIAEDEEGGKAAEGLKKKEWERAEKWRKMAKIVKTGKDGEGMEFEFDARSSKLIERTWKGIPDRWRAAAWHSFLSSSAKKRKDSATDEAIIEAFHKLLQQGSADDVQIDIDVPRTINSHIMFRRRYRGGQRLLFRVLHSLSLYFPDTGYVQGMASLAATLLCYYDEERCFVMLVRMWTLRGLDKLYEAGFAGLMSALDELEKQWLKGGEVSEKLTELCIEPTAYGTRWYLTLFNYSIPFPAQLRVWDVFMLLGDSDLNSTPTKERPFNGGLDVLHATSAALIDGTREILMDSDFENAMKVLTSWIPVKDEELLMRVAKAEWKLHRAKRRS
ncbi:TBC domain-containing protein [Lachnellula willkommii]|uniref:TBC domain-containing protein n=1 Tax=Lachnellula willkommii TaxID=215461 RepID=A0A559MM79_9HELO|nr:TBC domain-containing protein [Lachnellula willkommii]